MGQHLKIYMEKMKGPQADILSCSNEHSRAHLWETEGGEGRMSD